MLSRLKKKPILAQLVTFLLFTLATAALLGKPGEWTLTGNLRTARQSHTATLLLDGRVLVVGGRSSETPVSSAELYDPATGQWNDARPLKVARYGHTASLMSDGRVLVAGGQSGNVGLDSVELYDPRTDSWAETGPLNLARTNHSATLLSNGRLLVAGGFGNGGQGAIASTEIYNPSKRTWTLTGDLSVARESHGATLLPDGSVLISGGFSEIFLGQFAVLDSAEVYDTTLGTWATVGKMGEARTTREVVLLASGQALVAGGQTATAERYDPLTQTWHPTGTLESPRASHTVTLLNDGRALVVGGNGEPALETTELFDTGSGRWAPQGQLNIGRSHHTATLLPGGKVLVSGGTQNAGGVALVTAELYEPGPALVPDQLVYPQLALGGGVETLLFLTCVGSGPWVGRVELDGGSWPPNQPWRLDGIDRSGTTGFEVQLSPGETRKFVLSSPSGPFSGWLNIRGAGESAIQDLTSAFFYNFTAANRLEDSTGVAPSEPKAAVWFPIESSDGINTGLAIRLAPAIMVFSLYGPDGELLEQTQQNFEGARFFDQIFSQVPANFVGSVKIESGVSFYLTVLRQEILSYNPLRFQLTSIPVRAITSE